MQASIKDASGSFTLLGRYGMVGVAVAVIYVVLLQLFEWLAVSQPGWNSATAFVIAVLFQYIGQGTFTFRRPLNDKRQIARFTVTVTVGLAMSSFIVGSVGPALGVSTLVSSLAVAALLPIFNFIVFLLWVFVDRARTKSRSAA